MPTDAVCISLTSSPVTSCSHQGFQAYQEDRNSQALGGDGRGGGGQEFQRSNGREVELGLFKTLATAEVYTHFVLINTSLSLSPSLAPPARSFREENTEQLLVGTSVQHRGGRRRGTGTGLGTGCKDLRMKWQEILSNWVTKRL